MPTASAVVADMIDMAVGRTEITFRTLELWSNGQERVGLADPGDLKGSYYMRFNVVDLPGVLGQIAGRLGQHGISIASVYQHEPEAKRKTVPVVIVTQEAAESDAQAAIKQISEMPTVGGPAERFRILQ